MAHSILKPLTDEELKERVGEFMNSFITLNKKNQASLEELKERDHDADLMLYQILKSSNGNVNSIRLIDMIQTLILNYMLENINLNGEARGISERDERFLCFPGLLLQKYTTGSGVKYFLPEQICPLPVSHNANATQQSLTH